VAWDESRQMPAKTKIQKEYILRSLRSKISFMAHLPHKPLKSTLVKHRSILGFPHVRLSEKNVASYHIDSDEPERLKDKTKIIALEEKE
jgi:hypothetical protein